jgi:uncharacterized protein YndB with AHSA1/START domain
MSKRSANHATFVIERSYPAAQSRVFAAWASYEAQEIWMNDPDCSEDGSEPEFDFRVGGHERFGFLAPDGTPCRFDATYYDIIENQRIVYCYEQYMRSALASVSLATIEFAPEGEGTRLTYTEQGVWLDDLEKPADRQEGYEALLDNLASYLNSTAVG